MNQFYLLVGPLKKGAELLKRHLIETDIIYQHHRLDSCQQSAGAFDAFFPFSEGPFWSPDDTCGHQGR